MPIRPLPSFSLCPSVGAIRRAWALALVALALSVRPAWAIDLEGEWYVLVHSEVRPTRVAGGIEDAPPPGLEYRDSVWIFEKQAEGLSWTVIPQVAFVDETGRYEQIHGERARLRSPWRPSASQLAEIRKGLVLDKRTARAKMLRRRGADAFESGEMARPSGASSVSFGERWTLEGLDGAPVFTHAASLSSGRSDTLRGMTRWSADQVDEEAGRIEGHYQRDGSEFGRFYMFKRGDAHPSDAGFAAESEDESLFGPGGTARTSVASLQASLDALSKATGDEETELRTQIRADIQSLVEAAYTRQGKGVRVYRAQIEQIVDEIERLCVVEGVSLEEIDRRFEAKALGQ